MNRREAFKRLGQGAMALGALMVGVRAVEASPPFDYCLTVGALRPLPPTMLTSWTVEPPEWHGADLYAEGDRVITWRGRHRIHYQNLTAEQANVLDTHFRNTQDAGTLRPTLARIGSEGLSS